MSRNEKRAPDGSDRTKTTNEKRQAKTCAIRPQTTTSKSYRIHILRARLLSSEYEQLLAIEFSITIKLCVVETLPTRDALVERGVRQAQPSVPLHSRLCGLIEAGAQYGGEEAYNLLRAIQIRCPLTLPFTHWQGAIGRRTLKEGSPQ